MVPGEQLKTTLSTKGQVTLPKSLRRKRRWEPGTQLIMRTLLPVYCSGPSRPFPGRTLPWFLAVWRSEESRRRWNRWVQE